MADLNWMMRNTLAGVFATLRSALNRYRLEQPLSKQAAPRKTDRDPWISAIDAVADMDEHALKDIGAPPWLIAEVRQRQSQAVKRLIDLQIR
jgi:hypothetical protein